MRFWKQFLLGLAGIVALGSVVAVAQKTIPDGVPGGIFNLVAPKLSNFQLAPLQMDSAGNLNVNVNAGGAAGGTSSTFGAAFPNTGTAAGFVSITGTMTTAGIDATGSLKVDCTLGCTTGTFNNNADGVATSATNSQAAAWLYAFNGATWDRLRDDASFNLKVNVQASSGSEISIGNVTTLAPAYVSGNQSAISLDTAGGLRVTITSGSSTGSTFNLAFPATGTPAGFISATGTMTSANVDVNGQVKVNCATGCSAGSFNNNADGVATSATNGQAAAWLYAWNGATWDRLEDDASKNLKINQVTGSGIDLGTVTTNAPAYTTNNNGALSLDTAGGLRVTITSGSSTGSTFNSAFPATGTAAGFISSTGTMTSAKLDVSGNLNTIVNNTVTVTETSGSGISFGAVTLKAPAYVSGNANPLSLDTAGGLRVTITSSSTITVTGGIAPNTLTSTQPLASPVLVAVQTPGTVPVYTTGTLNLITSLTDGGLVVDPGSLYNVILPKNGMPAGFNSPTGLLTAANIDAAGLLKVNVAAGGGAGGTSSSFNAAFPGTGTASGFISATGNMTSGNVDASGLLKTNCVAGCAGGTFNNNADGVATSATNGQAAAWLYAWNGATWDRLEDDASKNLKVNQITGSGIDIGTVTTNAPSYTTNTNNALSLDTAGGLRTTITSSATINVTGGVAPGTATNTNPLQSPVLAAVQTPGTIPAYVTGQLQTITQDTGGALFVRPISGCAGQPINTQSFSAINLMTSSKIITGVASQNLYVCSIDLVTNNANGIALVEGTGTTCATNLTGMAGGTTGAGGRNFAANGGLTKGDGLGVIYKAARTADNICLILSAGNIQLSGSMTWVSF